MLKYVTIKKLAFGMYTEYISAYTFVAEYTPFVNLRVHFLVVFLCSWRRIVNEPGAVRCWACYKKSKSGMLGIYLYKYKYLK